MDSDEEESSSEKVDGAFSFKKGIKKFRNLHKRNKKTDHQNFIEDVKKYEIGGPGLFVILMESEFQQVNVKNLKGYEKDRDNLLDCFNLTRDSKNLILGENIIGDLPLSRNREKTFSYFMKQIYDYNGNPSFIFVTVMSHGFDNGSFLLSGPQSCRICNAEDSWDHEKKDQCHVRELYDHVVEKIQECNKFLGKPKIFLLQACRGPLRKVEYLSDRSKSEDNTTQCIPHLSDTVVMMSASKNHLSYVHGTTGSYMIREFCAALEKLKEEKTKHEEKLEKLAQEIAALREKCRWEKIVSPLDIPKENFVNGWAHNVFHMVSHSITKEIMVPYSKTETMEQKDRDIQQPTFTSSLRRDLSFLDILESTKQHSSAAIQS